MEKRFIVREGLKSDCKEIRRLIQELADFQNMSNGPRVTANTLEVDGFETSPPLFKCFVAEDLENYQDGGAKLVGYAIYFYTYSTWNGKKMHLEDVFVSEKFRKRHIGVKLFKEVAQKALADNCAYLDFSVLSWNPANKFYEALGAVNVTKTEDWNLYRLEGEALIKTAMKDV